MKTTVNFFRTLLLAVLTLTFGACGEDSLLSELGLDGQTSTKVDGAGKVWDGKVATAFAGGSGTAEEPYLIADGAQLARFAAIVNGTDGMARNTAACGKLTADILLNNTEGWESWETTAPTNSWTPIGSDANPFAGTLDGDGHSVSGIYINSTANYQGLVGFLDNGGTLQNLGVKASYIKGGGYVGGLCGWNTGNVTNCYNSGSLAGSEGVGGLCGYNDGTVTNCYYLTGTATGGIGYGSGDATEKTAEQFKSGEVAWLLGEGWGQTIGTDNYPVLDADGTKRVYAVTLYQGSDAADARYLNSNSTFPTLTGNAIALVDADSPFKTGTNIVVKDGDSYTCAELVLTDGEDFYTPVKFTATKATYTRRPSVWAKNDGSGSGWETICLPFSGTLYAGEEAKEPVLTDLAGDYCAA